MSTGFREISQAQAQAAFTVKHLLSRHYAKQARHLSKDHKRVVSKDKMLDNWHFQWGEGEVQV